VLEKTLKDGTKIVMKELSALEEMLAIEIISKDIDESNDIKNGMQHRFVSCLLSIVKVDDEDFIGPTNLEEAYALLANLPSRKWKQILEVHDEVNSDEDELKKN